MRQHELSCSNTPGMELASGILKTHTFLFCAAYSIIYKTPLEKNKKTNNGLPDYDRTRKTIMKKDAGVFTCFPGLLTSHDPAHGSPAHGSSQAVFKNIAGRVGSGQEVFEMTRVVSCRVGSCRVVSGRVGSGRVGSGRVGSGRVGSGGFQV